MTGFEHGISDVAHTTTYLFGFLKYGPTASSFIIYFRSFQTNIITMFERFYPRQKLLNCKKSPLAPDLTKLQ